MRGMGVDFLTPVYGLVALGVLLPLAALRRVERRAGEVRNLLRLPDPPAVSRRTFLVALVALPFLLGAAAAQPVLDIQEQKQERTDAQAYVVMDITRSMLASQRASSPNRFDRARSAALKIRAALPEVPFGIASLTDRTLPHLFPTIDADLFAATLERGLDVERPPPIGFMQRVTTLGALSALGLGGFFTPGTERRVAIVLTDAETRPFSEVNLGSVFRRPPGIEAIFVRFWDESERIFDSDGEAEIEYRPDARSADFAEQLAEATEGRAFHESELDDVVESARDHLGEGETEVRGESRSKIALAPWLVGAAFLPLAFLLWRRNL